MSLPSHGPDPTDIDDWKARFRDAGQARTGELRLLQFAFEDALHILATYRQRGKPQQCAAYLETQVWLASDDTTWPYYFRPMCDAFNLDADAVRAAIYRRYPAARIIHRRAPSRVRRAIGSPSVPTPTNLEEWRRVAARG